jgi:ABC-type Fe3+-hydroxamate transport system substrate-binding protein
LSDAVLGFADALRTVHPRAGADERIACLVPSITELICDLGLAPQLVARTGFCVHPREALRDIPKVGGTKDVDLEKLRGLKPTHVVVNIDETLKATADALAHFVPHVVVTHPQGPEDNLALYRLIGGIFNRESAAAELCTAFEAALAAARRAAAHWPVERVLYLIWKDPWMTVAPDTYIARTLKLVGWETVLEASTGVRYPSVELPAAARDADLVLLSTEPYMFRDKHVGELQALLPGRRVALIDGEMSSWYGSRAVAGLAYLPRLRAQLTQPRQAA